jgi:hypothetical protein
MRPPQSSSHTLSLHLAFILVPITLFAILPVRARATTLQLQCSPLSMRFGQIALGQSETQIFTLRNSGTTSITISGMSSDDSEFSPSGLSLPVTLAAGQTVAVNVIFAPSQIGIVHAEVTFTSNATDPNLLLPVVGTGVTTEALTAEPSSVVFGQLAVGSSATHSVTLSNTTASPVTLQLQTVGNNFSVQGPSFPLVLTPNQSIAFTVVFAPQAVGVTSGSIFISGGPRLNIPLSGIGAGIGALSISPTALNFGSVNVGTVTQKALTINATGGSVTISSATSTNAEFTLSGFSFPLTLTAGQSVDLDVIFSPSQTGNASGTLVLASNASSALGIEPVTGTGSTAQYSVSLSWSPSSSSVAGYNVYRGSAVGAYSRINTALDANVAYTDNTVVSGSTYYYAATSVNSSGQESGYSSPLKVVIP